MFFAKEMLKLTFILMMALGAFGFIGGALIGLNFIQYHKELPLSVVSSLAVDKDENIYVALEFYGHVQKYSSSGEFIKSWRVKNAHGGSFNIRLANNSIVVSTARGNSIEKYDLEGNHIKTTHAPKAYTHTDSISELKLSNGKTYKLTGFLDKKIILLDQDQSIPLIEMNWINKLLRGPMPSWILAFLGGIGKTFIIDEPFWQKKERNNTNL